MRIGFIGAGENTRKMHLPGFRAIADVELAVVCNRSEKSSRLVADQFGIPRIAPVWTDVVADPGIEAICIGTWPCLHAEITIAALAAGKHVLTEARMARDAVEAAAMLRAARAHPHLVAQIVPAPFSLRWDATVRRILQEGQLGSLRMVSIQHTHSAQARADAPMSWRQDLELSGHNCLTLGIFQEIIQRWTGEEAVWVLAEAQFGSPARWNERLGRWQPLEIPEGLTVLGRLSSGAPLRYLFSGLENGQPVQEIRLHGTLASLRLDVPTQTLWFAPAGQSTESPVALDPSLAGAWRVEADFVESIRDGKPVLLTNFPDGEAYMRFTDAVWQSWQQHGIKVPIQPGGAG